MWLHGALLVEVLPGDEAQRYCGFMNPQGAARFFGAGLRPAHVA